MKDETLRIERRRFPNGAEHIGVLIGPDLVGWIEEKPDGYLPFGCRKAIPSFSMAVARLIQRKMARKIGEAAVLARALESRLPNSPDEA